MDERIDISDLDQINDLATAVSFKIVVAFSDSWKASKFMLPSGFHSLNSVHSTQLHQPDSNRDTHPTIGSGSCFELADTPALAA